ncbi:hypothetical protein SynBIOSE41_01902 [Synechococcus sp. BIOS-E4-1]|nr:hypothetical protein SynBIOSE41_01902 [Synechococcus sp. BIOS-E4-1]
MNIKDHPTQRTFEVDLPISVPAKRRKLLRTDAIQRKAGNTRKESI